MGMSLCRSQDEDERRDEGERPDEGERQDEGEIIE